MKATNAATLPPDIKTKLLAIRDHLVDEDIHEAYTALYSIADPGFLSHNPWQSLEQREPVEEDDTFDTACSVPYCDELHEDDLNVD